MCAYHLHIISNISPVS